MNILLWIYDIYVMKYDPFRQGPKRHRKLISDFWVQKHRPSGEMELLELELDESGVSANMHRCKGWISNMVVLRKRHIYPIMLVFRGHCRHRFQSPGVSIWDMGFSRGWTCFRPYLWILVDITSKSWTINLAFTKLSNLHVDCRCRLPMPAIVWETIYINTVDWRNLAILWQNLCWGNMNLQSPGVLDSHVDIREQSSTTPKALLLWRTQQC